MGWAFRFGFSGSGQPTQSARRGQTRSGFRVGSGYAHPYSSSSLISSYHDRPLGLNVIIYLKTGFLSVKCLELVIGLVIPFPDKRPLPLYDDRLHHHFVIIYWTDSSSSSSSHNDQPLGYGVMLHLKTGFLSAESLELATGLAIPFPDKRPSPLYDDRLHHRLIIIYWTDSSSLSSSHHDQPLGFGMMLYLKTNFLSTESLELATGLAIPFPDKQPSPLYDDQLHHRLDIIYWTSFSSPSSSHHDQSLGYGVMLYLKSGFLSAESLELAIGLTIISWMVTIASI
ncbi:unnamed protein product [Cuscuta europaea]|uniref:Uncharacterized protein n=1 Tax=Cuscuta europaea TaxID=41803 RepID=A0A9P1EAW7_CUSEU|nr:unnamed protein product [Cuscuta europaea]